MVILYSVAAATLLVNVMCALMEAALLAVPQSRVEALKQRGSRKGVILSRLRDDIDRPIAAILILNTIGSTGGTILTGKLAGDVYGTPAALFLFTFGMAAVLLFIGDLMPKVLGATHAEFVATHTARVMHLLVIVLSPLVWLCRQFTRLFGARSLTSAASEEDIRVLARLGAEQGQLLPEEARWINNAMHLNEITAYDIMTPRTVVYVLPADLPLHMVEAHSAHWKHSRLPLVKDDRPDHVEGLVLRRDVFDALVAGRTEGTLRNLMKPVTFVPDTMPANKLLQTFIQGRSHLAVVIDEFGGMEGVVTLEDVLECLLGEEIVDEHDQHVDMQEYARRRAIRRGLPIKTPETSSA